jgi:hypothetical protein
MKKFKYLIRIISFLIICINSIDVTSQSKLTIEYSNGAIFLDKFGASSNNNNFNGHAIQSEIVSWYKIIEKENLLISTGIGYNNLWLLGVSDRPREVSSYLIVKFGMDIILHKNRFYGLLNLNNNILLNKKNNLFKLYANERTVYSNIDLGLRYNIGEKTQLSIWSPITILPLFYKNSVQIISPPASDVYNIWVEMIGLNIGIKLGF